jgi:hypothetical protein
VKGGTFCAPVNDARQATAAAKIRFILHPVDCFDYWQKRCRGQFKASRGDQVKPSGIPVLGRFYGEVDDNQVQMSRYFKTGEKLSKIDSSFKSMVKAGDDEAVQAFVEKNPDIALVQIHRKVGTSIAELNRLAVQTVGDTETLARIDEARVGLMSALNQAAADAGQASR